MDKRVESMIETLEAIQEGIGSIVNDLNADICYGLQELLDQVIGALQEGIE